MSFQKLLGMEGMFLGFFVSKTFESALALASRPLSDLLLSGGEEYLCRHTFQGQCYIGKEICEKMTLSQLEVLESHIHSLLRKLVPDFPYAPGEMSLFSLVLSNSRPNLRS